MRLYLVRVNFHRVIGPFDLSRLKRAHGNMEFGLQDEICGHLGEWIPFDNIELIQRHYPELTSFIKNEMFAGWGVSEQTRMVQKSRKRQFVKLPLSILFTLLVIGGAGYFGFKKKDLILKVMDESTGSASNEVLSLYESGNHDGFNRYIRSNRRQILKSGNAKEWLPILRIYAFSHAGEFDGISPKVLRGAKASVAPNVCSLKQMNKSLPAIGGHAQSWLEGGGALPESVSRILFWDPRWIVRRSPAEGWISPGSYFEGCLLMLEKALVKDQSLEESLRAELVARVEWMLAVINGTDVDFPRLAGVLGAITCIEGVQDSSKVDMCLSDYVVSEEWLKPVSKRASFRKAWLAIGGADTLLASDLPDFRLEVAGLKKMDTIAGLNHSAEIRFFQEILLTNGDVSSANDSTKTRYEVIVDFLR